MARAAVRGQSEVCGIGSGQKNVFNIQVSRSDVRYDEQLRRGIKADGDLAEIVLNGLHLDVRFLFNIADFNYEGVR